MRLFLYISEIRRFARNSILQPIISDDEGTLKWQTLLHNLLVCYQPLGVLRPVTGTGQHWRRRPVGVLRSVTGTGLNRCQRIFSAVAGDWESSVR